MPEPTIDAQRLDQARREISRLVVEIEQLADLDLPPSEFYVEISRRAHVATAAEASALWVVNAQGALHPAAQVNVAATGIRNDDGARETHEALLRQTLKRGQPCVLPPGSRFPEAADAAAENRLPYLLLLAPFAVEGVLQGVFELFVDPKRTAAQMGLLRLAQKTADETARYARNRRFRQVAGREKTWNDLDAFIRAVHGGLNPKQVAYLLANDGRRLIGVERVSVAVMHGERCRIDAVSGQDTVEKRSNLIRTMARLGQTVLKHGEPISYAGSVDPDWPKDVARALSTYIEESNSRLVIVTPLYDKRDGKRVGKPKAALVIETIADAAEPEELAGKIDVVARHGSLAFYNADEVSRIFLLPLWKGLGWVSRLFTGSRFATTMSVLALVAVTTATLTFLPWTLWLEGKGALVPEVRRTIFAPVQGEVEEIKVGFKSNVQIGSELLVLSNPQLKDEWLNLRGSLSAKLLKQTALQAAVNERNRQSADVQRDKRDIAELETEIDGIRNQLRLLDDQLDKLKLRSPIEGQVMTWQPDLKLQRRPVERGEPLLEVARTAGEWIVEVDFPEKVVAHLQHAREAAPNQELSVSFVVSSAPGTTYTGVLYELATQAEPKNGENVCAGKVRLDRRVPPDLRLAGAEVRVKVDCGRRALGYVLFREVIDFARERVFF